MVVFFTNDNKCVTDDSDPNKIAAVMRFSDYESVTENTAYLTAVAERRNDDGISLKKQLRDSAKINSTLLEAFWQQLTMIF